VCRDETDGSVPFDNGQRYPYVLYSDGLISTEEYCALETVRSARNYDGIAQARSEKPKRQSEMDQQVPEQPIFTAGHGDVEGDAQTEAAAMRAREGLGSMVQVTRLAHYFDDESLDQILSFTTAQRTIGFVKELQGNMIMQGGELPQPRESADLVRRRAINQINLVKKFESLETLRNDLRNIADIQRRAFARVGNRDADVPDDNDVPPQAEGEEVHVDVAEAYFIPSEQCQRPSDYVAQLAKQFEAGSMCTSTGKMVPKKLKYDQTLFLAQFASACNAVWEDEKKMRTVNWR
jgi:hypothetical protein